MRDSALLRLHLEDNTASSWQVSDTMGLVNVEVASRRRRTEHVAVGIDSYVIVQGTRPIARTEEGIQNCLFPIGLAGIGRKLVDNATSDINKTTSARVAGPAPALDRAVQIPRGINGQAVKRMNSIRAAGATAEVVNDALLNFSTALRG